MGNNILIDDSLDFAVQIIRLVDGLNCSNVLKNQILKSSTSIGANLREAYYSESNADFIHKLRLSLKECYETEYWLELLFKSGKIVKDAYSPLFATCGKMRKMLISSINTLENKS